MCSWTSHDNMNISWDEIVLLPCFIPVKAQWLELSFPSVLCVGSISISSVAFLHSFTGWLVADLTLLYWPKVLCSIPGCAEDCSHECCLHCAQCPSDRITWNRDSDGVIVKILLLAPFVLSWQDLPRCSSIWCSVWSLLTNFNHLHHSPPHPSVVLPRPSSFLILSFNISSNIFRIRPFVTFSLLSSIFFRAEHSAPYFITRLAPVINLCLQLDRRTLINQHFTHFSSFNFCGFSLGHLPRIPYCTYD